MVPLAEVQLQVTVAEQMRQCYLNDAIELLNCQ